MHLKKSSDIYGKIPEAVVKKSHKKKKYGSSIIGFTNLT